MNTSHDHQDNDAFEEAPSNSFEIRLRELGIDVPAPVGGKESLFAEALLESRNGRRR